MLSVAGLHLWRGDRHVLRNVNLTVNPGQCVLLTGRNGAGKTTLLRAIAGLLDPEEGHVSWRGVPARQTRDAFHSELAYLGHEPPLKGDLTGRQRGMQLEARQRSVATGIGRDFLKLVREAKRHGLREDECVIEPIDSRAGSEEEEEIDIFDV